MYIYALVCPTTKQVRYIGKTDKPKSRFSAHLSTARSSCNKQNTSKSPLVEWILSLLASGLQPVFQILREFDSDNWRFWEAFYYEEYASTGLLLNAQPLSSIKQSDFAMRMLITDCKQSGLSSKQLAQCINANYGDMCAFLRGGVGSLSAPKVNALQQFIDELRPQVANFDTDSLL